MPMRFAVAVLALLLTLLPARAQDTAAAGVAPQASPLQPFVASYEVLRGGKPFGAATLQLVPLPDARWRVDLDIRGNRGLLGLAGLNLQQSTLFDLSDGQYRPLSQSTVRKAVFGKRMTTGVYDWRKRQAQWQGDVKKTRRRPVPLQPGDMSGLLINLAVLRDAQPGAVLRYRFVDDGRVRDHEYRVSAEREPVTVDGIGFHALRVSRTNLGGDETVLWVVDGVPMPVRILQRENGEDATDLRLIEYKGT